MYVLEGGVCMFKAWCRFHLLNVRLVYSCICVCVVFMCVCARAHVCSYLCVYTQVCVCVCYLNEAWCRFHLLN
jgi:hypothetical protein